MQLRQIIAASTFRRTPSSVVTDPDAIVHADFVSGVYEMGGAPSTLGAIIGGTIDGGAFSSHGIDTSAAGGCELEATPAFIVLMEPLLDTGFTVIIDLETTAAYPDVAYFGMTDTDSYNTASELLSIHSTVLAFDYGSLDLGESHTPANFNSSGYNRMAFTIGRDVGGGLYRYAQSCNGEAIDTINDDYQELAYKPSASLSSIGRIAICSIPEYGYYLENHYLRRLIVYPPMTDSALIAKSAVGAA